MIEPDEHLKAIFDEAVKVARANDHEYITLEHITLVLLTQPQQVLKQHHISWALQALLE